MRHEVRSDGLLEAAKEGLRGGHARPISPLHRCRCSVRPAASCALSFRVECWTDDADSARSGELEAEKIFLRRHPGVRLV